MPPKSKAEKAIEAELKKKTTAQAKNIVALLKGEAIKPDDGKKAEKKIEKATVARSKKENSLNLNTKDKSKRVADRNSNENAKKLPIATVSSMDIDPDLIDLFPAETSSQLREKSTVATKKDQPLNTKEKSKRVVDSNSSANPKKMPSATVTSMDIVPDSIDLFPAETSSESREKFTVVEASKNDPPLNTKGKSVGRASNYNKSKTSVRTLKSTKLDAAYHYEIDCKRVEDSVDVADLKLFLEKQLKVDGKKDHLNGTVSIHCEGPKAVIKSRVYMPKKSLRFLSKKFLKKNWNIQVVSKNVHSYEYKYVGTL